MSSVATFQAGCIDQLAIFEEENETRHRKEMCLEYLAEVSRRDGELVRTHNRNCPHCNGTLQKHGKTKGRDIITGVGKIKVRLSRLRCVECKVIIVPGAVLIPKGDVTAVAAERMCDLSAKMPYNKATDSFFKQHKIKISDKKYWNFVQEEARGITDVIAESADKLFTRGIAPSAIDLKREKPLIIGIDGGHIPLWRKGDKGSFEAKCVTVATGSLSGPGKKHHLRDRVGYSADTDTQTFGQRVSALALAAGYLSASETIFVSDGAPWIPELISTYFPGSIHLLDMYHLKHRIQIAFTQTPYGCTACHRIAALKVADNYDPKTLLAIIRHWKPTEGKRKEMKQDLIEYITNNSDAIKAHKSSKIHGSGWIEKGVDLMISRRLKNRGMSWTRRGASHMIAFEVLLYNDEWNAYWNQRKGLDPIRLAA